jgi:alkylhydroperoxidase family enzyme
MITRSACGGGCGALSRRFRYEQTTHSLAALLSEGIKSLAAPLQQFVALAIAQLYCCAEAFGYAAHKVGLPRFRGQVDRSHAMTLRLSIDDQPNQDQAPVHASAEAGGD